MRILFCGLKYEYGKQSLGLSFEYQNFYEVLRLMPQVEADGFFIDEQTERVGRDSANELLIKTVEETKPDLLFTFLFTEELKKETVEYITKKTTTKTFNWFADDHWRFPVFSKHWAPLFTGVSTTDSESVSKYKALGVNIIKTQWAANVRLYRPHELKVGSGKLKNEVVFVGKKYGKRGGYIKSLKSAGVQAEGYGSGWGKGRVEFEGMLEIFSNSKINLNFTQSPYSTWKGWFRLGAGFFVKKENILGHNNFKFQISNFKNKFQSAVGAQRRQIKGRTFEIPACGGFLLSEDADNLREYYLDGKEIVIFKNTDDMIDKARYYLNHEDERLAIAKAGYNRTLKEHTYEQRFMAIFRLLGIC